MAELYKAETFNLGSLHGEVPMKFQIGHADNRVALKVIASVGEVCAFLNPAQARELGMSLIGMADNVAAWEGVNGPARRDAVAHVDTIKFILPTGGVI